MSTVASRGTTSRRGGEPHDILPAGAVRKEDGSVVFPGSVRPDGSVRKEIRVKAGFLPAEQRPRYETVPARLRREAEEKREGNVSHGTSKSSNNNKTASRNETTPQAVTAPAAAAVADVAANTSSQATGTLRANAPAFVAPTQRSSLRPNAAAFTPKQAAEAEAATGTQDADSGQEGSKDKTQRVRPARREPKGRRSLSHLLSEVAVSNAKTHGQKPLPATTPVQPSSPKQTSKQTSKQTRKKSGSK